MRAVFALVVAIICSTAIISADPPPLEPPYGYAIKHFGFNFNLCPENENFRFGIIKLGGDVYIDVKKDKPIVAECRTDAKLITSYEVGEKYDTIWCATREDTELWERYLMKAAELRSEFVKRQHKPCRILPPDFKCACKDGERETTEPHILFRIRDLEGKRKRPYGNEREDSLLVFMVFENNPKHSFEEILVRKLAIEVRLRDDGLPHTSLRFGEKYEEGDQDKNSIWYSANGNTEMQSATILIPTKEDLIIWAEWLTAIQKDFSDYLETINHRLVPKDY